MNAFPVTPSLAFRVALAMLLALAHAVLAVTATTEKSMTCDEIAHLTAGLAYNQRGDFRLQPENGNLPQRWAALPATLAGAALPPVSTPAWQRADIWNYGHAFFYQQGIPADLVLFSGRAMIALFGAGIGLLIFFWSRSLFGWRGAFLSLVLFTFSPAFLAHSALATSDIVMTFFLLAAVGAWWRALGRRSRAGAAGSAVVFGFACVAKFSAVLLIPMFGLCALVWLLLQRRSEGWRRPLGRILRLGLAHAAVAWAIIWIFYGVRFSVFAPGFETHASFYRGDWNWILDDMGAPGRWIAALRDSRMLPEAFLYGFAFVLQFARERSAFLSGDYSLTGWTSFFPFAFIIKTTLPLLILSGAAMTTGILAFARRKRELQPGKQLELLARITPLAALFVVYWATSLTSHLNIGHRHILPTYPVLFIAAGWLGRFLDLRRPLVATCVAGLTLWHAGESLRIRPHYLAYFNQIVGGPEHGWRHLVDSSLDWGQDLPGLKRWLDAHARGEKIYLSYFGTGDPAYEGIRATLLPCLPEVGPARPWHTLFGGTYALSATMLQHVYSPHRGEWTLAREKDFQALRALEPQLLAFQNDPHQRAKMMRDAPVEHWDLAWKRYENLRFARLCHGLRVRVPDAQIGYSVLLYKLTDDDIAAATGRSLADWTAWLERSTAARVERMPSAPAAQKP